MQRSWGMVIALMGLVAQASSASDLQPRTLVLVPAMTPYVAELMHGAGTAEDLLEPGQTPHDFALNPKQTKALSTADFLIVPTRAMNTVVIRLAEKQKQLHILTLAELEGANPLPKQTKNPWISVELAKAEKQQATTPARLDQGVTFKENHWASDDAPPSQEPALPKDAALDPHLWLDPERMAALAPALARAMGEALPAHRNSWKANATKVSAHLRQEVMPELRAMLAKRRSDALSTATPTLPYITSHAAYAYFFERFELPHTGQIMNSDEESLGAADMDATLNAAKSNRIRCVISEDRTPFFTRIADIAGATLRIFSPELRAEGNTPPLPWIRNDYDRFLYHAAARFGECL